MTFNEERGNLLSLPSEYALVHCVAHDCAMGAGIAKQLTRKYSWLRTSTKIKLSGLAYEPRCVYVSNNQLSIFNLITKRYSFGKPTNNAIYLALEQLKKQCMVLGVKKLGMPLIGCGLDKLNWEEVKGYILDIFKDTDIEIQVRYL